MMRAVQKGGGGGGAKWPQPLERLCFREDAMNIRGGSQPSVR